MKRLRSEAGANLYDAAADIERAEYNIAKFAYIAGIDESLHETLTIDDLISSIRNSFMYTSPIEVSYEPAAIDWLRQANFHLIIQARKYWWYAQMARARSARG